MALAIAMSEDILDGEGAVRVHGGGFAGTIQAYVPKRLHNKYVEAAFVGLRPATVGLIAAAALLLMNSENFIDYKSFLLFGAAFFLTWRYKIHPILMILLAGVAGLFLYW